MKSVFDFSLRSFGRFGRKNLAIALIFTFLVFLLSSAFMITHALKTHFLNHTKALPELVIQRFSGGLPVPIAQSSLDPIWIIPGVEHVKGRVWGHYFLELDKQYVSIVGIEPFIDHYRDLVSDAAATTFADGSPVVLYSPHMESLLRKYASRDRLPFLKQGGGYETLRMAGPFDGRFSLLGNDILLMPMEQARAILGVEHGFTDAFVRIPNEEEVATIATKISRANPSLTVTTKETMIQRYVNLYDYKSGWFLTVLLVGFVTFAILLYDKASGISSQERKEIGVLKALGWEVSHIIQHKLTEALLISVGGFFIGFVLALCYVFFLEAPLLKEVFTGYDALKPAFSLPFSLHLPFFALLFFGTVPLYLAVSIIPAWRASVEDAGEVIR
ncbi:MAG: FtsX-like permease family protein [Marichromatium sp.]|nr:FtsX-like permease family protein [Marichromatium sp.]